MITADKLKLLTNFPTAMLQEGIRQTGYSQDKFNTSKFLGLTNGGEFCYSVTFTDIEGDECTAKVFVKYDPAADRVSFDY